MSRQKSKKFLKIALPIVAVAGFTGLIIGISGAFVNTSTISIGGSSAVLPLINAYANQYKSADIITSAGGSGVGISSIIDGTKEIGMVSKDPDIKNLDPNNNDYKVWKEKEVKTLTIAYDAIAIVYKPSNNFELDINENNISKIYQAFSGIKKVTLGELNNSDNDNNTVIKPYARNGGASISGTADGFLKNSGFKDWDYSNYEKWNKEQKEIANILEEGNYGSNVTQTAESNSQAWNRVKDGQEGSMIYLSAGFVIKNIKTIESNGFKVATYMGEKLNLENVAKGYQWYRPFNLIYSMKQIRNNNDIINALMWMLFDEKAKKICGEKGFVFLNEEQIKNMGWNGLKDDHDFLIKKEFADIPIEGN